MSLNKAEMFAFAASLGMPADMMGDVGEILQEELPKLRQSMQALYEARDYDGLFKCAHSYKGSVASVTNGELWQAVQALELLARHQHSWAEIDAAWAKIPPLHDEMLAVLATF